MPKGSTYKDSGVDIDAGNRFADGLRALMRQTFTARVIPNPGGFGSLFSLDFNGKLLRRRRVNKLQLKLFDSLVWLWRVLDSALPLPGLSIIAIARKPRNP